MTTRYFQHQDNFYIFNSFFLEKLTERDGRGGVRGYNSVKMWTKVGTSSVL